MLQAQPFKAASWGRSEPWLSTLRHIANEGRVYVIGCCTVLRYEDIPDHYAFKKYYGVDESPWINVGDSAIVNPDGKFIAGPVRLKEDILYAEIESPQMTGPRWILDVAGHYARPDVFQFGINRASHPIITQSDSEQP